MADVGHARYGRLLAAGMLLATLVACQRVEEVQIGASGLPPAGPAPSQPTTSFQGQVAAVDAGTGIVTVAVAVQIIWTPVLRAEPHERRVLVDSQTRWDPAPRLLSDLRVGEEIQVEAVDAVEGVWPAVKVQLLDID